VLASNKHNTCPDTSLGFGLKVKYKTLRQMKVRTEKTAKRRKRKREGL